MVVGARFFGEVSSAQGVGGCRLESYHPLQVGGAPTCTYTYLHLPTLHTIGDMSSYVVGSTPVWVDPTRTPYMCIYLI